MKQEEMRSLKEGDLVMCLDAVDHYDTKKPHTVVDVNEKYIHCRATALRKGKNGDNLSNPDSNMFYGFNDHALLQFAGTQIKIA